MTRVLIAVSTPALLIRFGHGWAAAALAQTMLLMSSLAGNKPGEGLPP
jgi:hypothetical protein